MPSMNQLNKTDSVNGNKTERNRRLSDVEAPITTRDVANKKYVDDNDLANKTSYWSATGANFIPNNPDVDNIAYDANSKGEVACSADGIWFNCPVNLPQGAVITAILVDGNAAATAETYTLLRNDFAGGTADTMATANIGTEDSSISTATIDNSSYQYWIRTSTLDTGDTIYGAKITYTTLYI